MGLNLESQVLSASHFNRIPLLEQQGKVDSENLAGIAAIFVENQMHHQYGAAILHRHLELPEGHVLVHSTPSMDVDICKSESLDSLNPSRLVPNALFLNAEDKFQAFEYDTGIQRTTFSDKFLCQLRNLLNSRSLGGSIAIAPAPAPGSVFEESVEYLLPDNQGMITFPRRLVNRQDIDLGMSVITGWTFYEDEDGAVKCKENKTCEKQPSGLHKIVKS